MRNNRGRVGLLFALAAVAVVAWQLQAWDAVASGPPLEVAPDGSTPTASAAGCNVNSDCPLPDQFCSKPAGNCNGSGTCEIRPDVCIQVYDPVCGCDGVTYSNSCVAASNGVNVASEGECGGPQCADRNESCSSDSDCCSGRCKRNGRCR